MPNTGPPPASARVASQAPWLFAQDLLEATARERAIATILEDVSQLRGACRTYDIKACEVYLVGLREGNNQQIIDLKAKEQSPGESSHSSRSLWQMVRHLSREGGPEKLTEEEIHQVRLVVDSNEGLQAALESGDLPIVARHHPPSVAPTAEIRKNAVRHLRLDLHQLRIRYPHSRTIDRALAHLDSLEPSLSRSERQPNTGPGLSSSRGTGHVADMQNRTAIQVEAVVKSHVDLSALYSFRLLTPVPQADSTWRASVQGSSSRASEAASWVGMGYSAIAVPNDPLPSDWPQPPPRAAIGHRPIPVGGPPVSTLWEQTPPFRSALPSLPTRSAAARGVSAAAVPTAGARSTAGNGQQSVPRKPVRGPAPPAR